MRLKQLFESPSILNKQIASKIIEDCKPYIHEVIDIDNNRLFRGLQLASFSQRADLIAEGVYKAAVRKDRKPLNSGLAVHKFIDDWMLTNLGSRFRSQSIFCTANRVTSLSFGKPFVILPIGKFSFAWSPFIEDLYSDVFEIEEANDASFDKDHISKVLRDSDYRTTDLINMINEYPSHEVMINCDEYYAFDENTFDNYFYPLYQLLV